MRSVNIYTLTVEMEESLKAAYERTLSHRDEKLRIKSQEIVQMRGIVRGLRQLGVDADCYEDWFYSFTIPHISREFDLLKVGKNGVVVNVELKTQSPSVTLKRVRKQLEQNRYYLSLIAGKIYSFTYVSDENGEGTLYTLQGNVLKKCSFKELVGKLKRVGEPVREAIESMFKPDDFLISPFGEPERFCENRYFLTEHQQYIRAKILTGIRRNNGTLWGITGAAGTGKTLLIYDIAKTLSESRKVCMIHCGKLSYGHQHLRELLENVDIIASEKFEEGLLHKYDVICVDETQRLENRKLLDILKAYHKGKPAACVFAYDMGQVLTMSELQQNNVGTLKNEEGFQEQKLAKTVRTSREIYAFINNLFDLKKRSGQPFENIDVLYAADKETADRLLHVYRRRNYRFITLASEENKGEEGSYEVYENSHDVIGLEFDYVLVMMDKHFYYAENGKLVGTPHPDYLYTQLLYQIVSRAKEKLCIIVRENEELFRELLWIVNRSL